LGIKCVGAAGTKKTHFKTFLIQYAQMTLVSSPMVPLGRVAIWPFLKLFARNKMVWPFGHFLAFLEC